MASRRAAPSGILHFRWARPSPVIALALHAGHEIADGLRERMAAGDKARRSEQDPGRNAL